MSDKKEGTWRVTQGNGRQYLVHTCAKAGIAQTCGYTVERLDEAPSAGEAERVQIADATSEIEAMARQHFERWTVWKLLPPVEPCRRFKGSYKDNLTAHLWVAYRDGYAQCLAVAAGQQPCTPGALDMPQPQQVWIHRKGARYLVLGVTSEPEAEKADKHPVTVFYQGPDGRRWTRTLESWKKSFSLAAISQPLT